MIMNMNEKGRQTKLLAAIAIIAMVVCVFAVALPADAADGETSADLGDGLKLVSADGLEIDVTSDRAAVSGIADGSKAASQGDFNTAVGQWSYLTIDGISDWMTKNGLATITVTQVNTALPGAYPEETKFEDNTKVNEGFDGKAAGTFLIPKDGSKVTLTFEGTDANEKTISKTIVIDCSDVYTQIKLGGADVSGDGYSYTDSSKTLAFTNYDGREIFYHNGDLKVTLSGANTITANAPKTTTNNAIIGAATSITIEMAGTTGSLTINQQADTGFGISAPTVTIGSSTAGDTKLSLTVTDGGNRAIYGYKAITIQNADVNVAASEKAIRGGSLTVTNSAVVANIVEGSPDVNSQGVDDIWGIKTNGAIDIGAGSKVTTDGFRIDTVISATINGIVIVDGDYQQSAGADLVSNITGLYVDNLNFSTALTAIRGEPAGTATSGIYLINDAAVYGNVQVQDATGTTVDKTLNSVENVQNTLNETTTESVTLIVPTDAGLKDLNVTSVPDGTVFAINATTGPISGTLVLNGSSVTLTDVKGYIIISEGSVEIDGEEISGEIADVDGTVRLSGSTAAGETLKITKADDAETARVIVEGNLTITSSSSIEFEGVEFVVADEGSVNVENGSKIVLTGSEMSVSGKVLGTDGTIEADAYSKVYATSGSIIAPNLTGAGEFYIEDAMEEYRISKNVVSNISTTAQQKVYIDRQLHHNLLRIHRRDQGNPGGRRGNEGHRRGRCPPHHQRTEQHRGHLRIHHRQGSRRTRVLRKNHDGRRKHHRQRRQHLRRALCGRNH